MPHIPRMSWLRPLSRPILLKSGRTLATLHDARDVLASGRFDGVSHSPVLESALELLLQAATSGHPRTVAAAPEQLDRAFRHWHLVRD